jgi:hypothetical protein
MIDPFTALMAALASIAGTYAFQRLMTNPQGSELSVAESLQQWMLPLTDFAMTYARDGR